MAVSTKVNVKGKNKKRKKSTMAGGACATESVVTRFSTMSDDCFYFVFFISVN